MPIIGVKEITPKNIRGVVPEEYRNLPYRGLNKGDKIVIDSCVFSLYPAKDKETKEPLVTKDGRTILNCTVYFGLGDGHYTSLKNNIVEGQMSALTGFDSKDKDVGYYPFKFDPETVEVIETTDKMGGKEYKVLAFQQ